MNIKSIITFLGITLIISCSIIKKQESKYFDFVNQEKSIQIVEFDEINHVEIPDDTLMKSEGISFNDSTFYYTGYKRKTNQIFIYKINTFQNNYTRNIINLDFDIEYPFDFGFINCDSIFLAYSPGKRENSHDSILFMIDVKGNIKNVYSFDDANVYTKNNPEFKNNDQAVILHSNLYEPFTYIDNKIFLLFSNSSKVLGDYAYKDIPPAGYIDTKTNKFYSINFNYPDIEYGKTFFSNVNIRFVSTIGADSSILYGFHYTPMILKYDFKKETFSPIRIKSSIYDTIYSAKNEKEVSDGYDFDMPYPKYFNILYDKYRKYYYRFIIAPPEYNRKISVTIYDSNFNFIAEGFPPSGFRFFFTKDYIISIGNKKQDKIPGKIFLTFYKMRFRNGLNTELIFEIKNQKKEDKKVNKPITQYIKKTIPISEKNYTVMLMHYEMCPYLRDFVLGFYQTNNEKFKRNDIYLILISENPDFLLNEMEKHKLLPEINKNIYIDSSSLFFQFNSKRIDMPRLVKIRNNKIMCDTIFENNESGVINLQNFIIEAGKEQELLKIK